MKTVSEYKHTVREEFRSRTTFYERAPQMPKGFPRKDHTESVFSQPRAFSWSACRPGLFKGWITHYPPDNSLSSELHDLFCWDFWGFSKHYKIFVHYRLEKFVKEYILQQIYKLFSANVKQKYKWATVRAVWSRFFMIAACVRESRTRLERNMYLKT